MKISELFGGNKNIAAINFMCKQKGITMPEREQKRIETMLQNGDRFFVFIDKKDMETLQMRERSKLLGGIVSGRVRRGVVLYFHDSTYREVTRENLKETLTFINPSAPFESNDKILVPKRVPTAFDDAMPDRPHKKVSGKGFQRTMIANEAMQRMSTPIII